MTITSEILSLIISNPKFHPSIILFFFRMLAQSYIPNIYTPTPIPLLYNPFTIVLHSSLSKFSFYHIRALHHIRPISSSRGPFNYYVTGGSAECDTL